MKRQWFERYTPMDLRVWKDGRLLKRFSLKNDGEKLLVYDENGTLVEDAIIQEWTDAKDAEGRKVYEGDILYSDKYESAETVLFPTRYSHADESKEKRIIGNVVEGLKERVPDPTENEDFYLSWNGFKRKRDGRTWEVLVYEDGCVTTILKNDGHHWYCFKDLVQMEMIHIMLDDKSTCDLKALSIKVQKRDAEWKATVRWKFKDERKWHQSDSEGEKCRDAVTRAIVLMKA